MPISLEKWCERNSREDILNEWVGLLMSSSADVAPATIPCNSNEVAIWECAICGTHVIKKVIDRIHIDKLPCSTCKAKKALQDRALRLRLPSKELVQLVKSLHASIPELYFLFYLKKLFPDFESAKKSNWLGHGSIDIFIPSLQLGIEYDGACWHSYKHADDLQKEKLCRSHNITLIRVREGSAPLPRSKTKMIPYNPRNENYLDIAEPLFLVLEYINKTYNLDLSLTAQPLYDQSVFLDFVRNLFYKTTLAYVWPEIINYWDHDKNNGITPNDVTQSTRIFLFMRCPTCGKEFQVRPMYYPGCRSMPVWCDCGGNNESVYLQHAVEFYKEYGHLVMNDNTLLGRRIYDWLDNIKNNIYSQFNGRQDILVRNGINIANTDIG